MISLKVFIFILIKVIYLVNWLSNPVKLLNRVIDINVVYIAQTNLLEGLTMYNYFITYSIKID